MPTLKKWKSSRDRQGTVLIGLKYTLKSQMKDIGRFDDDGFAHRKDLDIPKEDPYSLLQLSLAKDGVQDRPNGVDLKRINCAPKRHIIDRPHHESAPKRWNAIASNYWGRALVMSRSLLNIF